MLKAKKSILSRAKRLYLHQGWLTFFTYFRYWEEIRYQRLEKMIPKKGTIIDLGCGYRLFANFLGMTSPQRRVIGLELDKKKLRLAEKNFPNVRFVAKDITKVKIPSADVIILMCALHHLSSFKEQEKLLGFCVKKLKKSGLLIIDEVDNHPWYKYLITRLADFLLYPHDKIFSFPTGDAEIT